MASVEEKVKQIIADELGAELGEVTSEKGFKDLGADKEAWLEMLIHQEFDFDLKIPDDEMDQMTTVGAVVDYIKSHAK